MVETDAIRVAVWRVERESVSASAKPGLDIGVKKHTNCSLDHPHASVRHADAVKTEEKKIDTLESA